jgi:hypothetical protein
MQVHILVKILTKRLLYREFAFLPLKFARIAEISGKFTSPPCTKGEYDQSTTYYLRAETIKTLSETINTAIQEQFCHDPSK